MSEDYTLEIIETERKKTGAIDGPEHILSCASCNAKLVHIKVIYPDAPATWNVYANCPCGDRSESLELQGAFKQMPCEGYDIVDISPKGDFLVYGVIKK